MTEESHREAFRKAMEEGSLRKVNGESRRALRILSDESGVWNIEHGLSEKIKDAVSTTVKALLSIQGRRYKHICLEPLLTEAIQGPLRAVMIKVFGPPTRPEDGEHSLCHIESMESNGGVWSKSMYAPLEIASQLLAAEIASNCHILALHPHLSIKLRKEISKGSRKEGWGPQLIRLVADTARLYPPIIAQVAVATQELRMTIGSKGKGRKIHDIVIPEGGVVSAYDIGDRQQSLSFQDLGSDLPVSKRMACVLSLMTLILGEFDFTLPPNDEDTDAISPPSLTDLDASVNIVGDCFDRLQQTGSVFAFATIDSTVVSPAVVDGPPQLVPGSTRRG